MPDMTSRVQIGNRRAGTEVRDRDLLIVICDGWPGNSSRILKGPTGGYCLGGCLFGRLLLAVGRVVCVSGFVWDVAHSSASVCVGLVV